MIVRIVSGIFLPTHAVGAPLSVIDSVPVHKMGCHRSFRGQPGQVYMYAPFRTGKRVNTIAMLQSDSHSSGCPAFRVIMRPSFTLSYPDIGRRIPSPPVGFAPCSS